MSLVIFIITRVEVCENGPHGPIGRGTFRRHGFVGVGVTLLGEVHHWGVGFEVSEAQARPSDLLSLPAVVGSGGRMLSYLPSTMSVCRLPCFLP